MARCHVGVVALLCCLGGLEAAASGAIPLPQAETASGLPPFLNLIPGTTNRAQVELVLGAPRGPVAGAPDSHEYQVPSSVPDASHVLISYFEDQIVSQVTVFLKTPVPAGLLRPLLGTLILSDTWSRGTNELYYPASIGLRLDNTAPTPNVVATFYLCPRGLANWLVHHSQDHLVAKRYADALTDADRAAAVAPDYAWGYTQAGRVFWAQKNYDAAAVRFMAAANAGYPASEKGVAHTWLGRIYLEKQLPDRARQEFEEGVALAPASSYTHYRLGLFLQSHQQEDRAVAEYSRALEADPDDRQPRAALADVLFRRDDVARALPHYERLSKSAAAGDPLFNGEEQAQWHFRYGECVVRNTEDWKRAHPSPDGAEQVLGITREERIRNDLKPAAEAFEKSVRLNRTFVPAWDALVDVYLKLGEEDQAWGALGRALAVNPSQGRFDRQRLRKLVDAGSYTDALLAYVDWGTDKAQWANRLASEGAALVDRARACAGLNDRQGTIQALQDVVKSGYRDAPTLAADPLFRKYANDREFKKILEQMR